MTGRRSSNTTPYVEPVHGYEAANFIKGVEITPPIVTYEADEFHAEHKYRNLCNLNSVDCREAMLQHVSENCCFGKSCARNMEMIKIEGETAFHYSLETFRERRKIKMIKEPYKGGPLDGLENGPAPMPWDIPCNPSIHFHNERINKNVPHTDRVATCPDCNGGGRGKCSSCDGTGSNDCTMCRGTGKKEKVDIDGNTVEEDCFFCNGSKKKQCGLCKGDGKMTCSSCEGFKEVKCFVQLKITYTTHEEDYIRETTDMPDDLVGDVDGSIVFEQTLPMVKGLVNFPFKDINENSCRLVLEHKNNWQNERIIMQRHSIRGVPVTEVHYKWKRVNTRYWIYGMERLVYAPDYPQQQCWGCDVL